MVKLRVVGIQGIFTISRKFNLSSCSLWATYTCVPSHKIINRGGLWTNNIAGTTSRNDDLITFHSCGWHQRQSPTPLIFVTGTTDVHLLSERLVLCKDVVGLFLATSVIIQRAATIYQAEIWPGQGNYSIDQFLQNSGESSNSNWKKTATFANTSFERSSFLSYIGFIMEGIHWHLQVSQIGTWFHGCESAFQRCCFVGAVAR